MQFEKLVEVIRMEGVKDLPEKQRNLFALALKQEAQGEREKAAASLDKAIAAV